MIGTGKEGYLEWGWDGIRSGGIGYLVIVCSTLLL